MFECQHSHFMPALYIYSFYLILKIILWYNIIILLMDELTEVQKGADIYTYNIQNINI